MPDVRLPDGKLIRNVPEGTTKEQLTQKLIASGHLSGQEDWLQPQQATQPQEQPAQPSEMDQLRAEGKRNIGLGARATLQAAATPVTLIGDLTTMGLNKLTGQQTKLPSQVVSEGLTAIGLPEPKTVGERITSAAIEGGTGGGLIAKGVKYAANKAPALIQRFTGGIGAETAAGTGAATAAQTTGEITDNPLARIGAAIFGGSATGKAASKIAPAKGVTPDLLSDVKESGVDEVAAFGNVRSEIKNEATKQRKFVNESFERAKTEGKNAFVEPTELQKFSQDLRSGVKNEIDREGKQLITDTADTIDLIAKTGDNLNEIQSLRRSASRISSKGSPQSYAAGQVVKKIDEFLDSAKIQGDPNSAKLWKEAIGKSRQYFSKFEDPAKIAKAIDSDETLETIEKSFLGTGPISSQKDLAKTYRETLNAVDSEKAKDVGFALRQSALNRIIKDAARASDSGEGLSAARMSNSIRNLRRENKSFWDEFTPAEQQILTKLEDDLRKETQGGLINKVYGATEKILRRGLRSNVELPRTLKPKTIITIEDLLELSAIRPKTALATGGAATASQTIDKKSEQKPEAKKSAQEPESDLVKIYEEQKAKYPGLNADIEPRKQADLVKKRYYRGQ